MHKLRAYLSLIFTVPAAILGFIMLNLLALGGLVGGYGFSRTFNVLVEEFKDAIIYTRVRLDVGKRK